MWKAKKNIWREMQSPPHSRLMDEWTSLVCPLHCSVRWGPVSSEGIVSQLGEWPERRGEPFLKGGLEAGAGK